MARTSPDERSRPHDDNSTALRRRRGTRVSVSGFGERSIDAVALGLALGHGFFKTSSVDRGVDGGGVDVGVAGELADAAP